MFNSAVAPAWVSEGSIRKFHRAVEALRKAGKPITEEAVKDLYVAYGGLIVEPIEESVDDEPKKVRKAK